MQAYYPADFKREMGCTEAELLRWLPGDTAAWHAFMRHFDLYTQRGGG
jgi:hypothetical protein